MSKSNKIKTIKSLESKVWEMCKQIIRITYPHICFTCGKPIEGKSLHTAHLFRKKFIPLQMKYDLRLLRPGCPYCNLRLHGNLEWYFTNLLRTYNKEYILEIADDIIKYKQSNQDHPLTTNEQREFLLDLLEKYSILINNETI